MHFEYSISIDEPANEEVERIVLENLQEFNEQFVGKFERKNFTISIRDENTKVIAGIVCTIYGGFECRITLVSVEEQYRKKGLGKKLLNEVEKYARSYNCKHITLNTAEFQAKGFYEKMGYRQITSIEEGFLGKTIFIMRKTLE